jgi:hypothetical protein
MLTWWLGENLACDRREASIRPFEIPSTMETAVFGFHPKFQ